MPADSKGLARGSSWRLSRPSAQSVDRGPAALMSPGSLLKINIHKSFPTLTVSPGMKPKNLFNEASGQFFCPV